jgi:hypothetical protein
MQPVRFICEIENSFGALGYSALEEPLDGGAPVRMTVLILRDGHGWARTTIIAPAEKIKELL